MDNSVEGILSLVDAEIADELQYYYVCPDCGQAVDEREPTELYYHASPGHERIPLDG